QRGGGGVVLVVLVPLPLPVPRGDGRRARLGKAAGGLRAPVAGGRERPHVADHPELGDLLAAVGAAGEVLADLPRVLGGPQTLDEAGHRGFVEMHHRCWSSGRGPPTVPREGFSSAGRPGCSGTEKKAA